MDIAFTPNGWRDFEHWIENDRAVLIRIKEILNSIKQTPFQGIGKPEPLKYNYKGYWSRRITNEHRLVYKVVGERGADQKCIVVQCRFHYDDL
ncbi:Txe/YoeB family addiction module toxin [Flavobacterium aurantiibacter]|uniref:Putative mRNA interferase YoeB n=1 Tax=Flavobacterium aurantiibacter TaxID=2023067 RepID=A0A256A518_9FLAO|nr:Txe/YoeB family addiction module toxin [Flavobacterium aurantiibacter]OYQ48195.1 Txe/YoeB family addiction module toxin [Flavobacterium aurantiibacter]